MAGYFKNSSGRRNLPSFFSLFMPKLNVTFWLIIVNAVAFIILGIFGFYSSADCSQTMCNYLALQPKNLFVNNYYWTLLTSMFVHANFFHLFVNMLSLFFIGRFLEMLIGKKRFFWLYIFSGIFAGLFFSVLAFSFGNSWWLVRIFGNPETFAVGASGAIFAIAGVLALLTPKNKVYLIAGPLIAIVIQAILGIVISNSQISSILNLIVTMYIIIAIFSMLSFNNSVRAISIPIEMPFWLLPVAAIIPLMIIGFFVSLPIGNMAHLGGFIAGACYGIYLRLKYKRKTRIIADYFSR